MLPSEGHLHREVLGRILAVARHLSASADLREILGVIIDAMRDTLHADRATVFEYDPKTNELFTTVAHGMSPSAAATDDKPVVIREIRIPATKGLAGECAKSRRIINVPDAYADARFNAAVDRQTGYRTRSILTIPLLGHDGELVGVAQMLNKTLDRDGGVFTHEDEEIGEALAAQAAVAMRRGRLIEDRLVRQKLERDIELARTIQQSSFPTELPKSEVFDIAAWNQPAEETGGDVYDVIASSESGGDRITLLMADATGHGVGPALSVTQLRSMLRMAVRLGANVAEIARHANQQLCADLPGGRFITAWIGELNPRDSSLSTISAGQAPLLHYAAASDTFTSFDADSVPFGVLDDAEFDLPQPLRLAPGDIYAVISDGIYEARGHNDQLMGADRVMECIRAARQGTAEAILSALRLAVDAYSQGRPADDDRTTIIIKRR